MADATDTKLILWELVNPSDPYTFYAPSVEVAGVVASLMSGSFGATRCDGEGDESTPVLFGWPEWYDERGIDAPWMAEHSSEIVAAYESFLIGKPAARADVEDMLAELPEDKREAWRARRQDRHRSSVNAIGERAYAMARKIRAGIEREGVSGG